MTPQAEPKPKGRAWLALLPLAFFLALAALFMSQLMSGKDNSVVPSALIGARTVAQLEDSLAALRRLEFSEEELARIDGLAWDAGIDIWRASSSIDAVE